jgi:hypothetical protein
MNEKMNELINYLNIENKNIILPFENKGNESKVFLDDEDINWVYTYYEKDFILWNKINKNPSLFKKVI